MLFSYKGQIVYSVNSFYYKKRMTKSNGSTNAVVIDDEDDDNEFDVPDYVEEDGCAMPRA